MKRSTTFYTITLIALLYSSSSSSYSYPDPRYKTTFSYDDPLKNYRNYGPAPTFPMGSRVPSHSWHSTVSSRYSISLTAEAIKKFSKFTTTSEWDSYFAKGARGLSAHLWDQAHRNNLFSQYSLYKFSSFREYIAGLEGYHEAMVILNHQITHDPKLAGELSRISTGYRENAKDFIIKEAQKSGPIVAKKHEEFSRAQQAAIAKQRQEIALREKQATATIQEQREQHVAATMQTQKDDLIAIAAAGKAIQKNESWHKGNMRNRANAIEKTIQEDFRSDTRHYTILSETQSLLQTIGLNDSDFTQCHGNTIQHVIHNEFVTNLNRTALLHTRHGNNPEVRQILESAVEFTHVGIAYNNAGHVKQAMEISNFVSALVDYGLAVAQGLKDAAINVAHSVLHPIDTVKNIARTAKIAGYYLGKVLGEIIYVEVTEGIDPVDDQQRFLRYDQNIQAMSNAICKQYEQLSGPEMVRAATSIAAETWLTAKCLGAAKTFYERAHAKALELASKVEQGIEPLPNYWHQPKALKCLSLTKRLKL